MRVLRAERGKWFRRSDVPRGYVDSEAALLRIAKTRHPDRWRIESMNEKEAEIYSGLGSLYDAEILGDLLRSSVPASNEAEIQAIAERLGDKLPKHGVFKGTAVRQASKIILILPYGNSGGAPIIWNVKLHSLLALHERPLWSPKSIPGVSDEQT